MLIYPIGTKTAHVTYLLQLVVRNFSYKHVLCRAIFLHRFRFYYVVVEGTLRALTMSGIVPTSIEPFDDNELRMASLS